MSASGDAVQILKAGILEIGDVYIVNKADLEGADGMVANLEQVIPERTKGWRAPGVRTATSAGTGVTGGGGAGGPGRASSDAVGDGRAGIRSRDLRLGRPRYASGVAL